jgi:streptogramin lyase
MPIALGHARTNHAGKFELQLERPKNTNKKNIFYAIAHQGEQIKLVSIMGETLPSRMTINELTTIGAAFSMAQFFHEDSMHEAVISGDFLGLSIAASMNENLVSPVDGVLSAVIQTSPNADETNSMRSINALANGLAACVQDISGACTALFEATSIADNQPQNTFQAVLNIAHYPAHQVLKIFELTQRLPVYMPNLIDAPDAWVLAIKFNDSGSEDCPFGGPAKLVFDDKGFVWINNNVIQGTPDSAHCMVVLKPNGQPADGAHHTPRSPIYGGGLLGPGFGITIDRKGSIWVGDFGWGKCDGCVPKEGLASQFTAQGEPISGPNGYTGFVERAQGLLADQSNNIWIASSANDRVVVFPHGDSNAAFYYQEPNQSGPFDIAIGDDGVVWVSNSTSSIVSRYMLIGSTIVHLSDTSVGQSLKQISLDATGHAWVASMRDSTVYELSPSGDILNAYTGIAGISHPWGVSVDSDQNIWVANFQSLITRPTQFSVAKLCGHAEKNCPPGVKAGDAISPETGYTLPTGGSQVRLHNGTPLYGTAAFPSFNPLMRLVYIGFDRAGNAWASNNWKPSALNDLTVNPGGDGVVVFIGLAGAAN